MTPARCQTSLCLANPSQFQTIFINSCFDKAITLTLAEMRESVVITRQRGPFAYAPSCLQDVGMCAPRNKSTVEPISGRRVQFSDNTDRELSMTIKLPPKPTSVPTTPVETPASETQATDSTKKSGITPHATDSLDAGKTSNAKSEAKVNNSLNPTKHSRKYQRPRL